MKRNIALITGGDSGEFEISIQSAEQMERVLDSSVYDIYRIVIKGKDWFYDDVNKIDKNDFSLTIDGHKVMFDCVFMALHGTPGENGKLQGYLDIMGIPYTTCDVTTSALTFNKGFTTKIISTSGVKTCRSVVIYKNGDHDIEKIMNGITLPCFVKPNNGGSSVAMSKVDNIDDLQGAIDIAFGENNEVIIEEYFKGRELTCGVYRSGDKVIALPIIEIVSHSRSGWFDFEAKYKGLSDEICPADVPAEVSAECRRNSVMLYNYLNCSGVVRFDYLWNGEEFRCLEVNTVPGMTAESLVPKMVKEAGMTLKEFYNSLIEEAIKNRV